MTTPAAAAAAAAMDVDASSGAPRSASHGKRRSSHTRADAGANIRTASTSTSRTRTRRRRRSRVQHEDEEGENGECTPSASHHATDEEDAGDEQESMQTTSITAELLVLHTEGYPYAVRIQPDRLTVEYVTRAVHALDVGTVRSNRPLPKAHEQPITYYEATILATGESKKITVGLAPLQSACLFAPANMHALDTPAPAQASLRAHDTASFACRQVGTDPLSYGYRGDEGKKYHQPTVLPRHGLYDGVAYGPQFEVGDTIGCGINYYDGSIFFTRNGRNLGRAFTLDPADWAKEGAAPMVLHECRDPLATPIDARLDFYAAVSLHSKGEQVRLNFGVSPFVFDIDNFRSSEQQRVTTLISDRCLDTTVLMPLIRSYLISQCYTKSLAALDQTMAGTNETATASAAASASASAAQPMDTDDADRAIKKAAPAKSSGATIAASASAKSAAATSTAPATELSTHDRIGLSTMTQRNHIRSLILSDDIESALAAISQLAPELWTRPNFTMLAPPHTMPALRFRLLSVQFIRILTKDESPTRLLDAIAFAQKHFASYQLSEDDGLRTGVQQLMGLLAYPDVASSPLGHLCAPSYREEIASSVNSALLACLCAPAEAASSAHGVSALEMLLHQTATVEATLRQHRLPFALPPPSTANASATSNK